MTKWIKYDEWLCNFFENYTTRKTLGADTFLQQYDKKFEEWEAEGKNPKEGDTILLFYVKFPKILKIESRNTNDKISYISCGEVDGVVSKKINGELYVSDDRSLYDKYNKH